MVDVNLIYKNKSDLLKAEDIGNAMPTYTIKDVELKTFDDGTQKLALHFLEIEKTLTLNVTNAKALAQMYGGNSDNWVNRRVLLLTVPTEFQGQPTLGIRLRAPTDVAQPQGFVTGTPNPNAPLNTAGNAGGDPRGDIPFPQSENDYGGVRG